MLEIRHLQLLCAMRAEGSFVGAAEQLSVSTSAVSHQLKEIESYYGVNFVNRKSRPLSFTSAGLEVLKLADTVLPAIARTHTTLKHIAHGKIGRLRLASECHSCFDWLMPVLNHYRKQWADVELDFATGFEPEPHESLLAGDIDVLITASALPFDNIHYMPLFQYESRLIVAPTHPLAQKSTISPQDLADEVLIAYPVEQKRLDIMAYFLLPNHINPTHIRTTELTAMLVQLVASERGVAALPDWVSAEYEKKGWITSRSLGDGLYCQLYAATRTDSHALPFVQGFLQLLKTIQNPLTTANS